MSGTSSVSVRRWRAATAACAALAAALLAWVSLAPAPKQDQRFVAVLQKDANSPAVLLEVDVGTRRLTIRPVSGQEPADKSQELWLIDASLGAPRSLGTLAPNGTTRASLASYDPAIIQGATYAVTLEPLGGSPTGKPSGPPDPGRPAGSQPLGRRAFSMFESSPSKRARNRGAGLISRRRHPISTSAFRTRGRVRLGGLEPAIAVPIDVPICIGSVIVQVFRYRPIVSVGVLTGGFALGATYLRPGTYDSEQPGNVGHEHGS